VLFWRRGLFAFSANLGAEESLIILIKFFRDRGIKLNENAQNLVARQENAFDPG
jgi:hypothetical protein